MSEAQEPVSAREQRVSYLKSKPNCRFVAPEIFCDLAVSGRSLERMDDPVAGLRGLYDRHTGEHFLTEHDALFQYQAFA